MRTFSDRQALLGLSVVVLALIGYTVSAATERPYVLGNSENWDRSIKCGRVQQSKPLNGTSMAGGDAPWMVRVNVVNKGKPQFTNGFMISDRHVVTTSDSFLDYNQDPASKTYRWLTDMSPADLKTCYFANPANLIRTMPVPNRVLRGVSVKSCADVKIGGNCQDAPAIPIAYADYIGNCAYEGQSSFGFVVLELAIPLKNVTPICLTSDPAQFEDELHVYGDGYLGPRTPKRVLCTKDQYQYNSAGDQMICLESIGSCNGVYGGPLTKVVDNQVFAVGAVGKWDCDSSAPDLHPSLGALSRDICQLTGVCVKDTHRFTYWSDVTTRLTTPMSPPARHARQVVN